MSETPTPRRRQKSQEARYVLRLTPYAHAWLISHEDSPSDIMIKLAEGYWKLKKCKPSEATEPLESRSVSFELHTKQIAKDWLKDGHEYSGSTVIDLMARGLWKIEIKPGKYL
jgi:hypothetical protein